MKREAVISLSVAALSLAFLPNAVQARTAKSSPASQSANTAAESSEAVRMVPAQAVLDKTLDARKIRSGQKFQATLSDKVKLKDGTELPRGTVLVGTVAADDMHTSGNSRLALRFTVARLKDGKTVPILATIVGIFPSGSPNDEDAGFWTPKTLKIDQLGAESGVDMHSRIDGNNSAVFVAAKKDDVKLSGGSEIALAIGAHPGSRQGMNSSKGGA
jgi:hypothetical protein